MSTDRNDSNGKPQDTRERPAICPNCGTSAGISIIYGYPSEEMLEADKAGEIRLGGCCINGDDPARVCTQCGHRWSEPGVTRH